MKIPIIVCSISKSSPKMLNCRLVFLVHIITRITHSFFRKSKDRVCFAFSKQKIVCIPDHNSEGLFCFCTLEKMYNFSSSSNSNKTYVDKKIFRLFSCIFSFLFCLNFIQNSRYSKLSNIIK